MLNWREYCKGFAIQKQVCDWEGKVLAIVGALNNIPFRMVSDIKQIPDGYIPSGTVPWVSSILGEVITPNYFPNFLNSYVTRKVWREEKWPLRKVFIKPVDKHKKFTGFITSGTYRGRKGKGPYICSEIVKFVDEWRYYISYGRLIGAYWYWGDGDEPKEAPKLDIQWPENWCGTADFGILSNGNVELVECHPPFACGWYGKSSLGLQYAEFLTLGWLWLKNKEYRQIF
jgi:hypothetical protein